MDKEDKTGLLSLLFLLFMIGVVIGMFVMLLHYVSDMLVYGEQILRNTAGN